MPKDDLPFPRSFISLCGACIVVALVLGYTNAPQIWELAHSFDSKEFWTQELPLIMSGYLRMTTRDNFFVLDAVEDFLRDQGLYVGRFFIWSLISNILAFLFDVNVFLLYSWALSFAYSLSVLGVALTEYTSKDCSRMSNFEDTTLAVESVFAIGLIVSVSYYTGLMIKKGSVRSKMFCAFFFCLGLPLFRCVFWKDSTDFLGFRFFLERLYIGFVANNTLRQEMKKLGLDPNSTFFGQGPTRPPFHFVFDLFEYVGILLFQMGDVVLSSNAYGFTNQNALSASWISAYGNQQCVDKYKLYFTMLKFMVVLPALAYGYRRTSISSIASFVKSPSSRRAAAEPPVRGRVPLTTGAAVGGGGGGGDGGGGGGATATKRGRSKSAGRGKK